MKKVILRFSIVALSVSIMSCSGDKSKPISDEKSLVEQGSEINEKKVDDWELIKVLDQFGDDTGERAYSKIFNGEFSNSATQNSDLKVQVIKQDSVHYFRLYEYGNNLVRLSGDDNELGNITIKDKNNEVKHYEVLNMSDGTIYVTTGSDLCKLMMIPNNELKIVIRGGNFSKYNNSSIYTFKIITK